MSAPLLVFDFAPQEGAPPVRRVFRDPVEVLAAREPGEVAAVLTAAEEAARQGRWVAGFVTYEAAGAFDPALATQAPGPLPLAWFGVFAAAEEVAVLPPPGPWRAGAWKPDGDATSHAAKVAAVRALIAAGETYQLNLTLRLRSSMEGDARGAWEAMQAAQRGNFGAWIDLGGHQLGSASPELFFRWDGERLCTRPMKGTVARGRHPAEDLARAAWLQGSAKDRAENAMIVDLLRNDLGRLAIPGSVRVPSLFALERYPTVWQLTSTVEARTRPGTRLLDVFGALFPCGSITGAPKVRTMSLLRELESSPRGIYCGAIGLLEPGGRATFSVAIRTLWVDRARGVAEYGTGGGITWDSDAGSEWTEAMAKARVLTAPPPQPFALLETLRLEDGCYPRIEEHLERLGASAAYFDVAIELEVVRARLEALARERSTGLWRVRLTVPVGEGTGAHVTGNPGGVGTPGRGAPARTGAGFELESSELEPTPPDPRVRVARTRVHSQDVLRFHKTTVRELYDSARAAHPEFWDVLLTNERGELTEFTRGNLVVELADGRRVTPPLDAGLLAGTLRARLLAEGRIEEGRLLPADLETAREIRFINDLRGEIPVTFVPALAPSI